MSAERLRQTPDLCLLLVLVIAVPDCGHTPGCLHFMPQLVPGLALPGNPVG